MGISRGETAIHRTHNNRPDGRPATEGRRRKKPSRRHPRRILGLWARLGLLALAIGVLVLAAVGLVAKAVRPYREARGQIRQLTVTEGQISAVEQDNAALRRRIAYLKTPDGVASEARRLGYLRPGERPIVLEAPVAVPAAPAPPRPQTFGDRARRFWRSLTGHSPL